MKRPSANDVERDLVLERTGMTMRQIILQTCFRKLDDIEFSTR